MILLSDMYYSSAQLRELMATVSPRIVLECDIIVSSEYDKTKRSGELFNEVLKRFSLCPEELTHYGDDSIADVSIPKSLGIRCVPVKRNLFLHGNTTYLRTVRLRWRWQAAYLVSLTMKAR